MEHQGKRILVMSFGSDAGGIEKSLIEFLKFLIDEGHKVDLYLWRKPGIMFSKIPERVNVLTLRLYPGELSANKSLKGFLWYCIFRLYAAFKNPTKAFKSFPENDYDVAVSYCQNGYSPHYIINKVKARKKIMFYHHGSYDERGLKKRIDYKYFARYDNFITVSNAAKNMLQSHFPRLDNIPVINNLIDESQITLLSEAENPYINSNSPVNICTVGRISHEKGQILAVKTAKRLKDSGLGFKWWFVGDGGDMERCVLLADELDVSDCCVFTGVKSNPYPFIKHCDVYVQPSFVEADPVTIREARILGCQIVANDIPALREALDGGLSGSLCASNPDDMKRAILSVLKNQDKASHIYQSANRHIKVQLRDVLR